MISIQLRKMQSGCIFCLLGHGVKIKVLSKMTLYIQDGLHFQTKYKCDNSIIFSEFSTLSL